VDSSPMVGSALAPAGGLLYSLLHLGGFAGDLSFYSANSRGRILELGCGDGRIAAALCLGKTPLTVLQQQQEDEEPPPLAAPADQVVYVGVELCDALAEKATQRLVSASRSTIVTGDFLVPLPPELGPFDTVVLSANTLFCTAEHGALLTRCADALVPGGRLLLDVYNALPWHPEESAEGDDDEGEEEVREEERVDDALDMATGDEAGAEAIGLATEVPSEEDLLVVVEDEQGREWAVYEREPDVEPGAQTIACPYEFRSGDVVFSQTVGHHYLLPEQLVYLLDESGFAIDSLGGGFDGDTFDPAESEHVVIVAHRKADC